MDLCVSVHTPLYLPSQVCATELSFHTFFIWFFITILNIEISAQLIEVTYACQQTSLNPILPFHHVSDYAGVKSSSFDSALHSEWMQQEPNLLLEVQRYLLDVPQGLKFLQ